MLASTPIPTAVKRQVAEDAQGVAAGSGINIEWSDNKESFLPSATLRKNCPCASCKEIRGESSHSKPLSAPRSSLLKVLSATIDEETNLQLIWPVGNYALGMKWADGHDSGIYPYSLLRTLTEG